MLYVVQEEIEREVVDDDMLVIYVCYNQRSHLRRVDGCWKHALSFMGFSLL
jgi:hypothetical protein